MHAQVVLYDGFAPMAAALTWLPGAGGLPALRRLDKAAKRSRQVRVN
ncbi:hypothetical protein [Streptosporangium sp. NPDC001681]